MSQPKPRTKEWLAIYQGVLKEFPVSEFGEEALQVAAIAADKATDAKGKALKRIHLPLPKVKIR